MNYLITPEYPAILGHGGPLSCYVCDEPAYMRVEFGEDLECITQVCSEGCGIRLLNAAEGHPACPNVWVCIGEILGQVYDSPQEPCELAKKKR